MEPKEKPPGDAVGILVFVWAWSGCDCGAWTMRKVSLPLVHVFTPGITRRLEPRPPYVISSRNVKHWGLDSISFSLGSVFMRWECLQTWFGWPHARIAVDEGAYMQLHFR